MVRFRFLSINFMKQDAIAINVGQEPKKYFGILFLTDATLHFEHKTVLQHPSKVYRYFYGACKITMFSFCSSNFIKNPIFEHRKTIFYSKRRNLSIKIGSLWKNHQNRQRTGSNWHFMSFIKKAMHF